MPQLFISNEDFRRMVTIPLAIFLSNNNTIFYCNDAHVESHLKTLASECYKITNQHDLARFTCHFFPVRACMLLHEANESPNFIKFRLHWKSDSYLMYLRNTPRLASQHNHAIDTVVALR